ncbi:MAG: GTP-binding protein [Elusimicrobia bacterium]|nr:GTP-binding protein [Candidatus Liberimonas magnetica]
MNPLKIVFIGDHDHGKSTLIGRLLYDTGSLNREKLSELLASSNKYKTYLNYSIVTDQLLEERRTGNTIDSAHIPFKTRKKEYIIIDTPGHLEFINSMISGMGYADIAVLVIDVTKGVTIKTRLELLLLSLMGIDKIILAVNKMDKVDFLSKIYEQAKKQILGQLSPIPFKYTAAFPISAAYGDNISKLSPRTKWYAGCSLVKALDDLKPSRQYNPRALRFPVQDVYTLGKIKVLAGIIISGSIGKGREVIVFPYFKRSKVELLKPGASAKTHENVGLVLATNIPAKRGDLVLDINKQPVFSRSVSAKIFWLSNKPLRIDKNYTIKTVFQKINCAACSITNKIQPNSFNLIEKPDSVLRNEYATINLKSDNLFVYETFNSLKHLNRLLLINNNEITGIGFIISHP